MIQAFRAERGRLPPLLGARLAGWPRFSAARARAPRIAPSRRGSAAGTLRRLVTQNVDGLHQRAGSRARHRSPRPARRRASAWPAARARRARRCRRHARRESGWQAAAAAAPDGDADVDRATRRVRGAALRRLRRPAQAGRRVLRRERPGRALRGARERAGRRRALLVAGSSLMVYSGSASRGRRTTPACRSRSSTAAARAPTTWPTQGGRGRRLAPDGAIAAGVPAGHGGALTSSALGSVADDAVRSGARPGPHSPCSRHDGAYERLLGLARDLDLGRGLLAHVVREVDRHLRARLGGVAGTPSLRPGRWSWPCRRIPSRRRRRP